MIPVFFDQVFGLSPRSVFVIRVFFHVNGSKAFGLVDKRSFFRVWQEFPFASEPFADLRVVHLWVVQCHLPSLGSRPHHKSVHGAFNMVHRLCHLWSSFLCCSFFNPVPRKAAQSSFDAQFSQTWLCYLCNMAPILSLRLEISLDYLSNLCDLQKSDIDLFKQVPMVGVVIHGRTVCVRESLKWSGFKCSSLLRFVPPALSYEWSGRVRSSWDQWRMCGCVLWNLQTL